MPCRHARVGRQRRDAGAACVPGPVPAPIRRREMVRRHLLQVLPDGLWLAQAMATGGDAGQVAAEDARPGGGRRRTQQAGVGTMGEWFVAWVVLTALVASAVLVGRRDRSAPVTDDHGLPVELRGAPVAFAERTFRSRRRRLVARLDRAYRTGEGLQLHGTEDTCTGCGVLGGCHRTVRAAHRAGGRDRRRRIHRRVGAGTEQQDRRAQPAQGQAAGTRCCPRPEDALRRSRQRQGRAAEPVAIARTVRPLCPQGAVRGEVPGSRLKVFGYRASKSAPLLRSDRAEVRRGRAPAFRR